MSQKLSETLKPLALLKVTLLDGCFSGFLNRANGTKSGKASQMWIISITFVVSSFLKRVVSLFMIKFRSFYLEKNP